MTREKLLNFKHRRSNNENRMQIHESLCVEVITIHYTFFIEEFFLLKEELIIKDIPFFSISLRFSFAQHIVYVYDELQCFKRHH
jgi:hypothetical protein